MGYNGSNQTVVDTKKLWGLAWELAEYKELLWIGSLVIYGLIQNLGYGFGFGFRLHSLV